MDYIEVIGIIAGAGTTIAFLPQAIKIHQTKHTKDLSLLMFLIFLGGVLLWLTYGILRNDLPVILANLATAVFAFYILIMKLKHG